MSDHIVGVQPDVPTALHVLEAPVMNLSDSFGEGFENIDVLNQWPDYVAEKSSPSASGSGDPQVTSMDFSQMQALQRLLTKKLAIVQGPPGTGKTYVSVQALRALMRTWNEGDPPVIITAQTNHALDQLLRHAHGFEPNFVRIGGQTTDKDVIAPRSLYNLKRATQGLPNANIRSALQAQKACADEMSRLLEPLTSLEPISPEMLHSLELITNVQADSFKKVEREYVGQRDVPDTAMATFAEKYLVPFRRAKQSIYFDEKEEVDDDENRPEEDVEAIDTEDDKFEELRGAFFGFPEGWTTKVEYRQTDVQVTKLLRKHQDVSDIPSTHRGAVFSYLQRNAFLVIRDRVRAIAKRYIRITQDLKIAKFLMDHALIKHAGIRIIGVTTTGLSKYRALLTSLQPRIILIEEAAETLESFITAGCFESVQQLLLVGDHQQLRPRTTMREHAGNDINLDLSMFERLVNNGIEMTQLKTQRRMKPDIRRLISPLYPELIDHPVVNTRKPVRGMGTVMCHFFHHEGPEQTDDALSKQNYTEAHMIQGFFRHLILNENEVRSITILTFYNGQKKHLRRILQPLCSALRQQVKVVTVDSYQGEENDIVILSTVRNNPHGHIGFLDDVHRVCVALSRARRGFYIFGHAKLLLEKNHKWYQILANVMARAGQLEDFLPITCAKHNRVVEIRAPITFQDLDGGCWEPCRAVLPCSHPCGRYCHFFAHDEIPCRTPCSHMLACGHLCSLRCGEVPCRCEPCDQAAARERQRRPGPALDPALERSRRAAADEWGGGPYGTEGGAQLPARPHDNAFTEDATAQLPSLEAGSCTQRTGPDSRLGSSRQAFVPTTPAVPATPTRRPRDRPEPEHQPWATPPGVRPGSPNAGFPSLGPPPGLDFPARGPPPELGFPAWGPPPGLGYPPDGRAADAYPETPQQRRAAFVQGVREADAAIAARERERQREREREHERTRSAQGTAAKNSAGRPGVGYTVETVGVRELTLGPRDEVGRGRQGQPSRHTAPRQDLLIDFEDDDDDEAGGAERNGNERPRGGGGAGAEPKERSTRKVWKDVLHG